MASNFGIKVSLDGKDVLSLSPGSLDLVFDTNANTFKVHQSGGAITDDVITHDLGYVPPFLVYCFNSLNSQLRMSTPTDGVTTTVDGTTTDLTINGGLFDSFGYFIFYNS